MTTAAPAPAPPERLQPARRVRRKAKRSTSLFAHGEPMVWLTGGALGLALAMIVGLLLLVLQQGLPTFWPGELVEVRTTGGRVLAGEIAATETYRPESHVVEVLDPDARARLAARDGVSTRRMLRTGNYELTSTHFEWVSDFQIESESQPEWILVVERLTWGRFYGTPRAITIAGERTEAEPGPLWELFETAHARARGLWEARRSLETEEVGRVHEEIESARLELREVELEHGTDSPQWATAKARGDELVARRQTEFRELQQAIAANRAESQGYRIQLVTADGQEKELALEEIVRAYPANRLGVLDRIGVYASRTAEFLLDDPRAANSEGGVFPAIFGTVLMTLIMTLVVVPFGVLAALYLREYARPGPIVSAVRIAINNLAGVPSIVFGVFGLGFFCYILGASIDQLFYAAQLPAPTYGKGGLIWASLTLALLTLPVVIVPTEEALAAVPSSMREGSYACGATKWQTIRRIVLPRALPGIMTGAILALARGAGEVAPLMLVGAAKIAQELPLDLSDWDGSLGPLPTGPLHANRSFMHLGFHIYDLGFQSQNSEAAKPMVYTTTLLLIALVVLLNLVAIWLRARLRRRFQGAHV